MKVRDVQERIAKLDPDLELVCYTEDDDLVGNRGQLLFEILDIRAIQAERSRLADGKPALKFNGGPASEALAIMEMTSDF